MNLCVYFDNAISMHCISINHSWY